MSQPLQQIIEAAWDDRANISPKSAPKDVADAVEQVLAALLQGIRLEGFAILPWTAGSSALLNRLRRSTSSAAAAATTNVTDPCVNTTTPTNVWVCSGLLTLRCRLVSGNDSDTSGATPLRGAGGAADWALRAAITSAAMLLLLRV